MAKRHCTEAQRCQSQPDPEGRRTPPIATAILLAGLLLAPRADTAPAPVTFDIPLIITQLPHPPARVRSAESDPAFTNAPPDGARIIALSTQGTVTLLTPDFASAADPCISFDARRILFAGKRALKENWNIWEMDLNGNNKRRLTRNLRNCREPKYLAMSSITSPEFEDKVRWFTFVSDAAGVLDELGTGLATALYAQNIEPIQNRGTVTRRTTFNLSSDFSPTVLSDGRVLFTSRQPADAEKFPHGRYPLMVSNWDGTVLGLFTGAYEGGTLKSMACEMPDSTLVYIESNGETGTGSGQLVRVSFRRPIQSREVLSRGPGSYRSPHALPDGRLLAAYESGIGTRGIFQFDFSRRSAAASIHSDPGWDEIQVVAAVRRPEPQGLLSAVVDSEAAVDLHCMNVYESDTPEASAVKKSDVKRIRFVEGVPVTPSDIRSTPPSASVPRMNSRLRILGEVPVEPDGSFFVRLPGDTPFRLQALNADGMVVQDQRGWIWVRRGTSRGCIGCHENRELAPENRTTQALIRIEPHSLLTPPATRRKAPDFLRDIRPILKAHCASCHSGTAPKGNLQLSTDASSEAEKTYGALLEKRHTQSDGSQPWVVPGRSLKSPIMRILDRSQASSSGGNGHGTSLSADEKRTFIEWIDLGARWQN